MAYDFVLRFDGQQNERVIDNLVSAIEHALKDGDIDISVSKHQKSKSAQQRKYAHYLISEVAKYCGYKSDDLKTDIKVRLGLINNQVVDGGIITKEISTEKLKRDDYGIFITEILRIAKFVSQPDTPLRLKQPKFFGFTMEELSRRCGD